MRYLIVGGSGFVGSFFVDALMAQKHEVTVYDNLSGGKKEFIAHHLSNPKFKFIEGDMLDLPLLQTVMKKKEFVIHLAANPDVRNFGDEDYKRDTQGMKNVLIAMKDNKIKKLAFSSTSAVYGETQQIPTPESAPLQPISQYGKSKVENEKMIAEHCAIFDVQAWIFRFANVIGSRGTHGVIVNFIDKLKANSKELEIMGDGKQSKSYVLVQDCVAAVLQMIQHSKDFVNICNVGNEDWVAVHRIAEIVSEEMGLQPTFKFLGGDRGWEGDIPKMRLSIDKIKALGWKPTCGSEQAVRKTVKALLNENI